MKIVTLMENGTIDSRLKNAHGLSLYIEHEEHKMLFDLGPNNNFLRNANVLGIDLTQVDSVIISHGHFDHGRGLKKFMEINSKAKIYISEFAFNKQYKKIGPINLPIGIKKPKDTKRIVFIKDNIELSKDMKIYANIKNTKQIIGDNSLLTKRNNQIKIDDFKHEIYLIIRSKENNVLFSGCSHKGIGNIVKQIEKQEKQVITHVLGGFHMSHYNTQDKIQTNYLKNLGNEFYQTKTQKYFSCHCTGDDAFNTLKPLMKDKLERIKTGSIINI